MKILTIMIGLILLSVSLDSFAINSQAYFTVKAIFVGAKSTSIKISSKDPRYINAGGCSHQGSVAIMAEAQGITMPEAQYEKLYSLLQLAMVNGDRVRAHIHRINGNGCKIDWAETYFDVKE